MRKVRLKDIGTFYSGLSGKSKKDFSDGNALLATYRNIFNNPVLNLDIKDTVVIGNGEKQNEVMYGDILFTGSSETPEEAGMSSVVMSEPKEKIYLNSFCFGFRLNNIIEVLPSYMGHLLRSESVRKAISKTAFGVTRFNINKEYLSEIEIPIPPLTIQREIVSVLDSFTKLIDKMKQEVELRKKQMEYYREKLIFSDKNTCRLSSICIFPKEKIASSELDMSNYVSVENLLKDKAGKTSASETPHKGRYYKYLPEDILLGNIRPYLKKIWYADTIGGTNGDVVVIRAKKETGIIPKFLYYALSSDLFFVYYGATVKNGKMPRGNKKKLPDFSFPIPPSSAQRSIVSILDAFETYISKLERLIALHEKQYAYYREKLLTFD